MILQGNLKVLFNQTMVFLFKKIFEEKNTERKSCDVAHYCRDEGFSSLKSRLASFLKTCLFCNGPAAFLLKASR